MPDTAIELVDVSKRFTKYVDTPMLLTAAMRFRPRTRREKLVAVRDMSLEVRDGESFGVIGRNGSGKTTLMSMMAGITAPTSGSVRVWGRVAPLIAVGVGFHRELTGRENIYLNSAILGLTRKQADERLDAIIDFSEIESFIDTPVKFYSSGMFVRLGFAVAVHSEPDILIVDEVLAVGDLAFQVKCFNKMNAIRAQGATIVMVSHNLAAVRRMCDRVLVMDRGRQLMIGAPDEAIAEFHRILRTDPEVATTGPGLRLEPDVVEIESVDLIGGDGAATHHFDTGQPVTVRVRARARRDVEDLVASLTILAEDGTVVYVDSNAAAPFDGLSAGSGTDCTMIFEARLATGTYQLLARLDRSDLRTTLASAPPVAFFVDGRDTVAGVADLGAVFLRDEQGVAHSAAMTEGPAQ